VALTVVMALAVLVLLGKLVITVFVKNQFVKENVMAEIVGMMAVVKAVEPAPLMNLVMLVFVKKLALVMVKLVAPIVVETPTLAALALPGKLVTPVLVKRLFVFLAAL
jgi:hypothetical protein